MTLSTFFATLISPIMTPFNRFMRGGKSRKSRKGKSRRVTKNRRPRRMKGG